MKRFTPTKIAAFVAGIAIAAALVFAVLSNPVADSFAIEAATLFSTSQINWGAQTGCSTATYLWAPADAQCEAPGGGGGSGVIHYGSGAPSQGTASTITLVQSAHGTSGPSSVAFGSSVTSGHLGVVFLVGETGFSCATTPTDTLGTVYSLAQCITSGPTPNFSVWVGKFPSSGADTVSFSISGLTNPGVMIAEFANATPQVDKTATVVQGNVSPSTSLTPSLSGDLVIGYGSWLWTDGTPVTFTAGSGFTIGPSYGGAADDNPEALEYLAGGTTSSTAIAIASSGSAGSGTAWGGAALYAVHTGSVGSDGDFYLDTTSGILYGPRKGGLYFPTTLSLSSIGPGAVGAGTYDFSSANTFKVPVTGSTQCLHASSDGTISGTGSDCGGGGGGSAFAQLAQVTVTTAGPTITFSSISGAYTNLQLVFNGQSASGSNDDLHFNFNGDTGSNYDFGFTANGGSSNNSNTAYFVATTINPSSVGSGSFSGSTTCVLPSYASTAFYKTAICQGFLYASTPTVNAFSGDWHNSGAITSIVLTTASGSNFTVGSKATLYGLQ